MAIKKEEGDRLTEDQEREVKTLEDKIDNAIREKYVPSTRITINIDRFPHQRVVNEIKRIFQEAGWKIDFHSDQREGNYISLS